MYSYDDLSLEILKDKNGLYRTKKAAIQALQEDLEFDLQVAKADVMELQAALEEIKNRIKDKDY